MNRLMEIAQILEQAGFVYYFYRELYVNFERKKFFSVEAIDNHDINWLKEKFEEDNGDEWGIYFNTPPSESVRQALIDELEGRIQQPAI